MKSKLHIAVAMAVFGTIPLFVRSIPISSSMLALCRAVIAAAFLVLLRTAAKKPVRKHMALPLRLEQPPPPSHPEASGFAIIFLQPQGCCKPRISYQNDSCCNSVQVTFPYANFLCSPGNSQHSSRN